jgi:predicted nucleotidyltransferase
MLPVTGAFDRYVDLKDELASLYQRRVDLLTLRPFRNHIFQAEIDRTKVLLYAA